MKVTLTQEEIIVACISYINEKTSYSAPLNIDCYYFQIIDENGKEVVCDSVEFTHEIK